MYDTTGREYLDFYSGVAVTALGHGDPEWVAAIADQAGKLAHISNIFYNDVASRSGPFWPAARDAPSGCSP